MPALDSRHHVFLQAVMSHSVLDHQDAVYLWRLAVPGTRDVTDEGTVLLAMFKFVGTINQALLPLGFEVRNAESELDGERVWGFVNTKADAAARKIGGISAEYVRALKKLVRSVFAVFGAVSGAAV